MYPSKGSHTMSNIFEIGVGSALACSAVIAQINGVDLSSAAPGLLDTIVRAGPSGILGGILIYALYRSGKTAEMLASTFKETLVNVEQAHKEASARFSVDVQNLVDADRDRTEVLDRAIQHCASVNGRPA